MVREMVRINHHRNCLLCHAPETSEGLNPPPPRSLGGFQPNTWGSNPNTNGGFNPGSGGFGGPGGMPPLSLVTAPQNTAQVPLPGQVLPAPNPSTGGYGNSDPEILIRIDVTYLRQDFSIKLPVSQAHPWPEMQRFDFVVRTRQVSEQEAEKYQELLRLREPGELSPYHRAALYGLRELTGRDTEPTAAAWRKLLAQTRTE